MANTTSPTIGNAMIRHALGPVLHRVIRADRGPQKHPISNVP